MCFAFRGKHRTRTLSRFPGDPRAARVLAVRAASRLEVESVRLFDQAPIPPIDLYHRRLRGHPALIRQAGSQTNEDARSVEAQTDEVRSNGSFAMPDCGGVPDGGDMGSFVLARGGGIVQPDIPGSLRVRLSSLPVFAKWRAVLPRGSFQTPQRTRVSTIW